MLESQIIRKTAHVESKEQAFEDVEYDGKQFRSLEEFDALVDELTALVPKTDIASESFEMLRIKLIKALHYVSYIEAKLNQDIVELQVKQKSY